MPLGEPFWLSLGSAGADSAMDAASVQYRPVTANLAFASTLEVAEDPRTTQAAPQPNERKQSGGYTSPTSASPQKPKMSNFGCVWHENQVLEWQRFAQKMLSLVVRRIFSTEARRRWGLNRPPPTPSQTWKRLLSHNGRSSRPSISSRLSPGILDWLSPKMGFP